MSTLALMLWITGALFTCGFMRKSWDDTGKGWPIIYLGAVCAVMWPALLGMCAWAIAERLEELAESKKEKP